MSVARFSWVPNLYNIHFLIENQGSQPDHVNSHPVHMCNNYNKTSICTIFNAQPPICTLFAAFESHNLASV